MMAIDGSIVLKLEFKADVRLAPALIRVSSIFIQLTRRRIRDMRVQIKMIADLAQDRRLYGM